MELIVETGLAEGAKESGEGNRYFFWADVRPGYAYAEHDDLSNTTVSPAGTYHYAIQYAGSGNFSVQVGSWGGTSTGWGSSHTAVGMQAGAEAGDSTHQSRQNSAAHRASVYASGNNLGFYDLANQARHNWVTSQGHAQQLDPNNWLDGSPFTTQQTANAWYRFGTTTISC